MPDFADFIVYADESGDHGMVSIDPQYPMFALTFCVMCVFHVIVGRDSTG